MFFYLKDFKNGFFAFHIVDLSPWPLLTSLAVFFQVISIMKMIYFSETSLINYLSFFFLFLCFFGWQKDILKESSLEGAHTNKVQKGIKMGMLLFIISEILFFFSFFWSLSYYKTSSSILMTWPPVGIKSLDPLGVPFLSTLILMSSGITITWCHHSVLENKWLNSFIGLLSTILLGFFFTKMQLMEYLNSSFTMSDSVYGSIFYLMTGFHGLHVIVGSTFLFVCLIRHMMLKMNFSKTHHVGLEAAIWYWHFVDVVWLFLYIFLYF